MKKLRIGVLGATGAVGREMLRLIEAYRIPAGELRLLSGPGGAGTVFRVQGETLTASCADEQSFEGLDYVLGASEPTVSRRFAPAIRRSGAVFIDNSSAFRLDSEVPLVVPEINGADAFAHRGVIANPNCSTVIALMAVAALHRSSPIRSMIVSTYQAVSGAGVQGLRELEDGLRAAIGGEAASPRVFPAPIAMNVIPWIGDGQYDGYTDEEMKMQNEGRRILHAPELRVSCTCVRVPVMRSHSLSLRVLTEEAITPEEAARVIGAFPGCRIFAGGGRSYPTPLDAEGQDLIFVGRIRGDLTDPRGLCLWCCGDQIRKGAAANALQILQLLERGA